MQHRTCNPLCHSILIFQTAKITKLLYCSIQIAFPNTTMKSHRPSSNIESK
jgi:gentisate 1,2-dioxygenase